MYSRAGFPLDHQGQGISVSVDFLKGLQNCVFSLWRRDPVLELQFLLSLIARDLLSVNTSLCKRLLCVKVFFLCVKVFCL